MKQPVADAVSGKESRFVRITKGVLLFFVSLMVGIAVLMYLTASKYSEGYEWLFFMMIAVIGAYLVSCLCVVLTIISLARRETHRLASVVILAFSIGIVVLGSGMMFQFGQGLWHEFQSHGKGPTGGSQPALRAPPQPSSGQS